MKIMTTEELKKHKFISFVEDHYNPLDVIRTDLRTGTEDKKIYRVKDREGHFLSLGIVYGDQLKLYKHF